MRPTTPISITRLALAAGVGRHTAARWVHGREVRRGSASLLESACRMLGFRAEEVAAAAEATGDQLAATCREGRDP